MNMKKILTIFFLLLLTNCKSKSIYNSTYVMGDKTLMIYPYQLHPLTNNPYYNRQCRERQILDEIQTESIEKVDIEGIDLILTKTSLKSILETYNYVTSLNFNNVCLDMENDLLLNNKIKEISISKSIVSNHKLVAKHISYCNLYSNDTVIDIFKNTHIDTLYIASKNLKRVDFENTTIDVLIPDDVSSSDSLDIDFIIKNNKVKKAYSKQEAKQYLIAKGQQDVY